MEPPEGARDELWILSELAKRMGHGWGQPDAEAVWNEVRQVAPAFAGGMAPRPQTEALEAGVKVSGCTVHFVTENVDAGPIIAQVAVPVLDDDTVETLSARILEQEHRLLPRALDLALSGRLIVDGRRVIQRTD